MMDFEISDSDNWSIFPITANISSSYVDTDKLILDDVFQTNKYPIGMSNFRSKTQNKSMPIINTLFNNNNNNNNLIISNDSTSSLAKMRWKAAASKAKFMIDPWCEFKLHKYPAERAIRHRYNAIKKQWIKDECIVKMEPEQFSNGAMRACFRLKKLSNTMTSTWESASNYVAKCYIDSSMTRERYFEDVQLQMDAKLWAELYNRHNPPKKIDMFQVSVLEFKDRLNSPLYHLEHFIDGQYIKYNSNSGFVEDVHVRNTPQAFSHFTFERSNHELIVVDVQGVGDLYTDPQIHTAKGIDYGEGNLGIKGFALFFSSHVCNDVCKSLGLSQFDLIPSEVKANVKPISMMQKMTQSRGIEELVFGSPSSYGEYFRQRIRTRSNTSAYSDENSNSNELFDIDESEGYDSGPISPISDLNSSHSSGTSMPISFNRNQSTQSVPISMSESPMKYGRKRNESYCLDSAFSSDEAINFFNSRQINKQRPSCVMAEKNYISHRNNNNNNIEEEDEDECYNSMRANRIDLFEEQESILGKIHLELCKYHEMGRFLTNENDEFNQEAAFFHLKQAAHLGVIEALVNMAKIYLQLTHDILPNFQVEPLDINYDIGFEYMLQCAEKGDKSSLYFVAKAYDTGLNLSKNKQIDWLKSIEYYQRVLNKTNDDDDEMTEQIDDCEPTYIILARMAEMNMIGEHNLEQDLPEAASLFTEAAEKAMLYGKGRLANKYYQRSEEASSMADNEDD